MQSCLNSYTKERDWKKAITKVAGNEFSYGKIETKTFTSAGASVSNTENYYPIQYVKGFSQSINQDLNFIKFFFPTVQPYVV